MADRAAADLDFHALARRGTTLGLNPDAAPGRSFGDLLLDHRGARESAFAAAAFRVERANIGTDYATAMPQAVR